MPSIEFRPGTPEEAESIRWRPNVWNAGKEHTKLDQDLEYVRELVLEGNVAIAVFEGRISRFEIDAAAQRVRAYMRRNHPDIPIQTKIEKDLIKNAIVLAVRLRPDEDSQP